MKPVRLPFIANLALVLISIVIIGYLLRLGQSILAPFFLAFLLAMLFVPFANWLERKLKFSRGVSSITALILVFAALSGLGYFFGSQFAAFSDDIPHLTQQFSEIFQSFQEWVSQTFRLDVDKQFEFLEQGFNKLLSSSGFIIGVTLAYFSTSLGFAFFCLLFFVFILNYRKGLNNFIINIFPDKHKDKVSETVHEIQSMTKSYITGICIQMLLITFLSTSVLLPFGVKYAILLGVLTGLINVIPYLGIAIAMLLASFITFATATPITVLYVVIGYLVIHAIDGNIIIPFIVGSKVKINALFSFLAILIGAELWGISGMFLCIPALAILKIIFERIESIQPWGNVLGESGKRKRDAKKKIKISKKIIIESKD